MNYEQFIAQLAALREQNPGINVETLPAFSKLVSDYTNNSVSSAVKAEKDKLYSTIEDFKKKNGELSQKNAELSTTVTDYTSKFEDLTKKVQSFIEPVTSANYPQQGLTAAQIADLNKQQQAGLTPAQIQEMLDKKFNEEIPNIIQNSLKPLIEVQTNLQKSTLEDYKASRLKELGDTVIPELVHGNSKEEIEASIEASKQVRARFIIPQTTPQQAPTNTTPPQTAPQPQAPQPQTVPPSPTTVTATPPSHSALDNIKHLGMNDFAKQREQLLQELKSSIAR